MTDSRKFDELVEALILVLTAPEENEDDNKELVDYADQVAAQFDASTVERAREEAVRRIKEKEDRARK